MAKASTPNPSFEQVASDLGRLATAALASVESVRQRIGDLARRRGEIEAAPCDTSTLRNRATRLVDESIADWRSSMCGDILSAPAAQFSDSRLHAAIVSQPAFVLFAACGNRDALIAALVAEAEVMAGTASPLSEAERAVIIEGIDRDLLLEEAREEDLCRRLESAGGLGASIARRSGANPAIVLARDHELADFLSASGR